MSAVSTPTEDCRCRSETWPRACRSARIVQRATSSGPTRTERSPTRARDAAASGVGRDTDRKDGGEPACKPSSVPRLASRRRSSICGRRLPDSSCGRPEDWAARPLPPERPVSRTPEPRPPIWPCSEQSLPRFTDLIGRTRSGYVSVALVLASRRTGVTRYPALWSSDFPRAPDRSRVLAIVQPTRRGGMVDQATRIANCGQRREQLGRSDRWNAWQQTNAA